MGYFTVEIKPTIAASKQADGAFAAKDVLFDWTSFDVPKGANKLVDVAFIVRGTDGAYQEKDAILYFAKSKDGGNTAPGSIGTVHATADGNGYFDHVLSASSFSSFDVCKLSITPPTPFTNSAAPPENKFPNIYYFFANFSTPLIPKHPNTTNTKESYTNSFIIRSLPSQPVTRSTIIITHIIANAMNPIIDFSFQSLLSLNISISVICNIFPRKVSVSSFFPFSIY